MGNYKLLILGLTGNCNFHCAYCYAHEQPQIHMSLATAQQAIDLVAASGQPFVLQFSGGEPLLAFSLLQQIADYVRQRQLPATMQLQTNASLIDDNIAQWLKAARIGVGISLDGRPKDNDQLRRLATGEGSSAHIFRGAQRLAAAGIAVGITCVVTNSNVSQLSGVIETAYYLGNVRKLGFDLLRAQGRGVALEAATATDLSAALQQVFTTTALLKANSGRQLIFSHLERVANLAKQAVKGFAHCHAMNGEALFVNPEGEFYACASLAGMPEFYLGNVQTGVILSRIHTIGIAIREYMHNCQDCDAFSLCGGACFARWYGAGCFGSAYLPECVLKRSFIDYYQQLAAGQR